MKAILGDINIQGHLRILLALLQGEDWREFWNDLNLAILSFRDIGLSPQATDAVIWQVCQEQDLVLLTANRNAEGPDSLEAILRTQNTTSSLPVFTIANARRVLSSRDYAERVVEQLLEYLQDIDRVRGVGWLYLP